MAGTIRMFSLFSKAGKEDPVSSDEGVFAEHGAELFCRGSFCLLVVAFIPLRFSICSTISFCRISEDLIWKTNKYTPKPNLLWQKAERMQQGRWWRPALVRGWQQVFKLNLWDFEADSHTVDVAWNCKSGSSPLVSPCEPAACSRTRYSGAKATLSLPVPHKREKFSLLSCIPG